MSMEDLLNIQVTSVSKTEQKLSQTASAIYVITQEDIQQLWGDEYSRSPAHGSGHGRGADQFQYVGDQRARL